MFNIIKKMKDRKAQHVKEVYDTEINPEEYLRREREIRKNKIIEVVSVVFLIFLGYALVKLWFAYEGFSIMW